MRLTAWLTLSVAVVSTILIFWFYFQSRHNARETLELRADSTTDYLAGALMLPVWRLDEVIVRSICDIFAQEEFVTHVRVSDERKQVIYETSGSGEYGSIMREHSLYWERPGAGGEPEKIGRVQCWFSDRAHRERLAVYLNVSLMVLAGVLVTIGLMIFVLNRLLFRKPIRQLATLTDAFSAGDYAPPRPTVVYTELEQLEQTLFSLGERILAQMKGLRESEEKYRRIFETVADGYLLFDLNGRLLSANPAAVQMLGAADEAALSEKNVGSDLFVSAAGFSRLLRILKQERSVSSFTTELRRLDGGKMVADCNFNLVEGPAQLAVEGTLHDMTERTAVLQESQRAMQTLVANLPGLAYRCRHDEFWTMEFLSEGCQKLTGYPAEAFVNNRELSFSEIIHPDDGPMVDEVIFEAVEQHQPYALSYRIYTKDRELKWVWEQGRAVFNELGEVVALEGLIHDISLQKKAEFELTDAKETAEAASRSKSEFLSNMSHEIRTPLNAVLGFTEVLLRKETDPAKTHYIDSIQAAGQALLSLINDILDLSKIEAGKLELSHSATSLQVLGAEMTTLFSQRAREKGVEFLVSIGEAVPAELILDELRLRQIFINLIGNALKFTEAGTIALKVDAVPSESGSRSRVELTIEVCDTGAGIPADQLDSIFGAFEQAQKSKMKKGGTGLGLSISKRLTEMMGGEISVESEEGRGATFRIQLPAVEVAAGQPEKLKPVPAELEQLVFEPSTVLIVDDIDYNREILTAFLESQPFTIHYAENGQEAIEQARAIQPDIILLDMKMPVMDGYEASEKMKADEVLKSIPIIAITASALTQDEERIMMVCNGYLRKPVDKGKLIEALQCFLPHRMGGSAGCERSTHSGGGGPRDQPGAGDGGAQGDGRRGDRCQQRQGSG